MCDDHQIQPEMRLTRAGICAIYDISSEVLDDFERDGLVRVGRDGRIGIREFAVALFRYANATAERGIAAFRNSLTIVGAVAQCGAILAEHADQCPDNAAGAAMMREAINNHVATMSQFHADLTPDDEDEREVVLQ